MYLGIDIGTNNLGFAILNKNKQIKHKEYLDLNGQSELKSLYLITLKLEELCKKYKIKIIILEHIFIQSGGKAGGVIKIVEAVGVVMLFCYNNNIDFKKLNIKTIKKQITGNGNAKKQEVINSINLLYNLKETNEHIADAIAICLCFILKEA
jgi:crossover junction endodeoxyribonuclease RuvC